MGCFQSIEPARPNKPSLRVDVSSRVELSKHGSVYSLPSPKRAKSATPKNGNHWSIINDESDAFGLLLCGSGESGKTTFIRQLKYQMLGGFPEKELLQFVGIIRTNMIETIQLLLVWTEKNNINVSSSNEQARDVIIETDPAESDFTTEICGYIRDLWDDPAIKLAFQHKDENWVPDNMEYFFNKLDLIAMDDYVPSIDDIIRARVRTIGIDMITIEKDCTPIRIFDVGGQKSERIKWNQIESKIEGVIFCISLADYDKPMFEDNEKLRITDSIEIFDAITHRNQFKHSPFFILCNKFDEFSKKVQSTDSFIRSFPEYFGDPHSPDQCAKFLIDRYIEKSGQSSSERPIIDYKLVAIDKENTVEVANAIFSFISENYFE